MTAKRKRRKRSRSPSSGSAGRTQPEAPSEGTAKADEGEAAATERRGGRGLGLTRRGLASIPSPYPPFAVSVAAGLRTVGASPVILAVAFLGVLAMWALFTVLGAPVSAGRMAGLMAVPPIHLIFDVLLVQVVSEGTSQVVLLALAVIALRAILLSLLTLLIVEALRGGTVSFRRVLARLPRVWAGLTQLYVIEVFLVLAAPILLAGLLGPQFGQLGTILVLVLGLHFLVMTPIVMAAEDARAPDALRWSVRAARLPGLRHFGLVLTYFFLALYVLVPVSAIGLQPATPSFLVWVFVLSATLVHVGVLGAFAYRWLAVREDPSIRGKKPTTGKTAGKAAAKGTGSTRAGTGGRRQRR